MDDDGGDGEKRENCQVGEGRVYDLGIGAVDTMLKTSLRSV